MQATKRGFFLLLLSMVQISLSSNLSPAYTMGLIPKKRKAVVLPTDLIEIKGVEKSRSRIYGRKLRESATLEFRIRVEQRFRKFTVEYAVG